VLEDVRAGPVSVEGARRDYGVAVDLTAGTAIRAQASRRPDRRTAAERRKRLERTGLTPPVGKRAIEVHLGEVSVTCLKIALLGGLEIRLDSGANVRLPTTKAQAPLAYLASRQSFGGRARP
jgi:hypothetical protein